MNTIFKPHLLFILLIQFISITLYAPVLANTLERPKKNINNVWYEYNNSETVFVFVHGIFSDSRDAWFHEDKKNNKDTYWPELIRTDKDIEKSSIFLGGFYTELDSGSYKIRDAKNQLYKSLKLSISPAPSSVLEKKNIIFIAHSTGGIVVRHLLVRHKDDFKEKNVGLILIASPSVGSKDADRFEWLAKLAKQKMGQQLKWNHPILEELDSDFKNLVDNRDIPCFSGIEALENHFIIKQLVFFDKNVLVEKSSAGRYFGEAIRLADTNHFSTVKPNSRLHPSYLLLRDFYENKFKKRNLECAQKKLVNDRKIKLQIDACLNSKITAYEVNKNKTIHGGARSASRKLFKGTPSSTVPVCLSVGPNESIVSASTQNTCCHRGECSVTAPKYTNNNRNVCVTTWCKSESKDFGGGGCGKYNLNVVYKSIATESIKTKFRTECEISNTKS